MQLVIVLDGEIPCDQTQVLTPPKTPKKVKVRQIKTDPQKLEITEEEELAAMEQAERGSGGGGMSHLSLRAVQ